MNDGPLHEQYLLEKELAELIKSSREKDRARLYSKVYNRFFRELPEERRRSMIPSPEERQALVRMQMKAIQPLLTKRFLVFLEVGSGRTDFSIAVAAEVNHVIALEASEEMISRESLPENLQFVIADSPPYPLESASVDVAFSSHFVEHLLREDAERHLEEIRRVLRPGGVYLCVTPNILYGPHDASQFFGHEVAVGLHLQEYSYFTLSRLGRDVGFAKMAALGKLGDRPSTYFKNVALVVENLLFRLSLRTRSRLIKRFLPKYQKPFRPLEQVKIVFYK